LKTKLNGKEEKDITVNTETNNNNNNNNKDKRKRHFNNDKFINITSPNNKSFEQFNRFPNRSFMPKTNINNPFSNQFPHNMEQYPQAYFMTNMGSPNNQMKMSPLNNMNLSPINMNISPINNNYFEISQKQKLDCVMMNPMFYNPFMNQQMLNYNYAQYTMQVNRINEIKKNVYIPCQKTNNKMQLAQYHEGSCNFNIFAKACKPYIIKNEAENLKRMNIESFFSNFEKLSIFGLDIAYVVDNTYVNVNYSPTLSSMELIINDPSSVREILNFLQKENYAKMNNLISNNESFELSENENYNIQYIAKENTVIIEFFENKPTFCRPILIDEITSLFERLPVLKEVFTSNLKSNSWFSLMWTPSKSSSSKVSNTSFLVYYQLNLTEFINKSNSPFSEIPIIGILPIKMEETIWLNKINSQNFGFNYLNFDTSGEFKNVLLQSIENVFFFILNQTKKCSFDYSIYLKGHIN